MTVNELIKELQKLPSNYEVMLHYDGAPRLICDGAYHAKAQEMYDSNTGEYITLDNVVVLCETADIYDKVKWFFKKG